MGLWLRHLPGVRTEIEGVAELDARQDLIRAVDAAIHGDWERAHTLAQKYEDDPTGCWIHAVLHKMEPDEANARYWYRKAGKTPIRKEQIESEWEDLVRSLLAV